MKIEADGFAFDFTDALDVFVFDEKDNTKPTFHGLPMKAVDIVVELQNAYIFIEMKDFDNPDMYNERKAATDEEIKKNRDHFKWLKNYLKYKYRDSYLFRHAENKLDKPIHFICLLTLDNALNTSLQKALTRELPVGKASKRWQSEIVTSCQVLNVAKWNANFPKWPLRNIAII
jgi:hypothetical protein